MSSKVSALLAEPLGPIPLGETVARDHDELGARRTAIATATAAVDATLRGLVA